MNYPYIELLNTELDDQSIKLSIVILEEKWNKDDINYIAQMNYRHKKY